MEEAAVWKNFKQGSEKAYTILYQKFAPVMFKYGCKISHDRNLVKDCLQLVFLNIWKNRAQIPEPPSVLHYLLKAIRNEVIKNIKFQNRFESLPPDPEELVYHSVEAELITLQTEEWIKQKFQKLLLQLPARQREVIFLKYYKDLRYEEIAAIMGIEVESVYKITYKAIEKLHTLF